MRVFLSAICLFLALCTLGSHPSSGSAKRRSKRNTIKVSPVPAPMHDMKGKAVTNRSQANNLTKEDEEVISYLRNIFAGLLYSLPEPSVSPFPKEHPKNRLPKGLTIRYTTKKHTNPVSRTPTHSKASTTPTHSRASTISTHSKVSITPTHRTASIKKTDLVINISEFAPFPDKNLDEDSLRTLNMEPPFNKDEHGTFIIESDTIRIEDNFIECAENIAQLTNSEHQMFEHKRKTLSGLSPFDTPKPVSRNLNRKKDVAITKQEAKSMQELDKLIVLLGKHVPEIKSTLANTDMDVTEKAFLIHAVLKHILCNSKMKKDTLKAVRKILQDELKILEFLLKPSS
ncbi:uncharacterized protein LOC134601783 [Pelobates fuscus]|uniref:uncharacterized protein LOC134601783 n=1 Tax=Pelobates fuscus TaxID=191477 RepID=UPI002FE43451